MPYIKFDDRKGRIPPAMPTELKHLAFTAYHEAMMLLQDPAIPDDYARRISIYGVLVGVAQEFWDRNVRPFENRKLEENGDVF